MSKSQILGGVALGVASYFAFKTFFGEETANEQVFATGGGSSVGNTAEGISEGSSKKDSVVYNVNIESPDIPKEFIATSNDTTKATPRTRKTPAKDRVKKTTQTPTYDPIKGIYTDIRGEKMSVGTGQLPSYIEAGTPKVSETKKQTVNSPFVEAFKLPVSTIGGF